MAIPTFNYEAPGDKGAFTEEGPGVAGTFISEADQIPREQPFNFSVNASHDYLAAVGAIQSPEIIFEQVPGNVIQDFTGANFGDDTYFNFGNSQDFKIGYMHSLDQFIVANNDNETVFGVDKSGGIRMKNQESVPSEDEVDTDLVKAGGSYYFRTDLDDFLYNAG